MEYSNTPPPKSPKHVQTNCIHSHQIDFKLAELVLQHSHTSWRPQKISIIRRILGLVRWDLIWLCKHKGRFDQRLRNLKCHCGTLSPAQSGTCKIWQLKNHRNLQNNVFSMDKKYCMPTISSHNSIYISGLQTINLDESSHLLPSACARHWGRTWWSINFSLDAVSADITGCHDYRKCLLLGNFRELCAFRYQEMAGPKTGPWTWNQG